MSVTNVSRRQNSWADSPSIGFNAWRYRARRPAHALSATEFEGPHRRSRTTPAPIMSQGADQRGQYSWLVYASARKRTTKDGIYRQPRITGAARVSRIRDGPDPPRISSRSNKGNPYFRMARSTAALMVLAGIYLVQFCNQFWSAHPRLPPHAMPSRALI